MVFIIPRALKELSFPEYRARHIFTAKLRLSIFIGFWFLYVILLKDYLSDTKPVTITILASFLVTTICYYNIFNNRYLVPSFLLEICADLVAMTAIVYLTGGPESQYYIIYIFYVILAGLFYNWRLALFVSFLSAVFYGLFLTLCHAGFIQPLPIGVGTLYAIRFKVPYLYPLLLVISLLIAVYATKIAHYFSQERERMLEAKNKELLALQRMSSTIRTVASLNNVLLQVLNGVLDGLNLNMCLLMINDKEEKKIRCIPPDVYPLVSEIEKVLGIKLREIYFPFEAIEENPALKQVQQGQIIFRRDILEVIAGLKPEVALERFKEIQQRFEIKRVIAIPLITGREVIGSMIAFTREAFIEDNKVDIFQAFADHASLAIEAAMLIEELRRNNIALIEANRVKSEFLATMSHELRTPLTAIIGFSELLLEGVMGALSEEQQDSLKEVLNNGSNLLEMINNLLDLAKVDSGKMELSRRTFDWKEMIIRIERSVAPLIKRKGHKLTIDIAPEIPLIFADEKRMQQIVVNLLSNAIKFTPDNGKIHIATEAFSDYEHFVKKYHYEGGTEVHKDSFEKGIIVCSVEDNGIGIDEGEISAIFDVFRQVDSSVTRSYEGSGLGLALVKQFVELHKGFVWVESKKDVGTKFTFVIPTM